jgi:hypothetical protein
MEVRDGVYEGFESIRGKMEVLLKGVLPVMQGFRIYTVGSFRLFMALNGPAHSSDEVSTPQHAI